MKRLDVLEVLNVEVREDYCFCRQRLEVTSVICFSDFEAASDRL